MDIKVNGRTLSDRPLVLGVQGDNNVEELRFLVSRYTDAGVDLSLGLGYAVFRLPDGTDGHVSLTPEVLGTDENTVSLTLLVGSQMTEQKGSGKLCLKVAGLESAMWSSTICDMFVNGTIAMPSPQPVSLFRTMSIGPRLAEEESEPPLTVTERTINIPAELQTIAVAQDENSETVKIVVPRYFDGQDLSVHDFILHTEMGSNGTDDILFNNQNGQMKAVEDSTVTLTWVLRPPQTSFEGKLNIQLLVQGDEFKWHSLIGELTIAKHITGDPVVPATPSMYEQWLAEVKEQADYVRSQASNIQTVVDEMGAIKDAPAAAERAEAAAAEAEKSAAESKGFRKFYSAVVPDANGNLDPSRPMTVGPAASVEIESAGDRIQSVTALGFTQQAGTGDPSPTNVRQLTNGGQLLAQVSLSGAKTGGAASVGNGYYRFGIALSQVGVTATNYKGLCSHWKMSVSASGQSEHFYIEGNVMYIVSAKASTTADMDAYIAENNVVLWYAPADESQATGLYAPIILTSGEYRATCLPLTAPLCEGDSVVSLAKSGCDKMVVLKGDQSENWSKLSYPTLSRFMANGIVGADNGTIWCNKLGVGYGQNQVVIGVGNTKPSVFLDATKFPDVEDWTNELAQAYSNGDPYILFYQSTNYTPAADIPVSLETHQQAVLVLDGTENAILASGGHMQVKFPASAQAPVGGADSSNVCSHAKFVYSASGNGFYVLKPDASVIFGSAYVQAAGWSSAEDCKAYLAAQYAAGTPVTIVYQLATPITYAHEPVVLEAATGDQLTYTVTGQSGGTVSVALKPFQDGGHAAMADNATNAVTAQTAANSQQLGGLSLSELQNLLVPVGYIFSWAPTSGGPDLSTSAKVAAYFGFGTWQAYGSGQVLVGLDAGQTEFATAGKTGGEKTHTLTTSEVPPQNVSAELDSKPRPVMVDAGVDNTDYGCTFNIDKGYKAKPATKFQTKGGGQAHNNLQPYVTVYRWQRVA